MEMHEDLSMMITLQPRFTGKGSNIEMTKSSADEFPSGLQLSCNRCEQNSSRSMLIQQSELESPQSSRDKIVPRPVWKLLVPRVWLVEFL